MSQAAHRYAEAFFELAQEMNQIDAWKQQMDQVALVMESVPELKGFFGAVKITNEEKKELLIKSFEGKIDEMCLNFLCLLTDKKRISEISLILKEFHSLCNAYKGIEEGVVYAPRILSENQIKELEDSFKVRGRNVELSLKIDESLISGFKIVLDDEVVDASMKSKIARMKNELLKERM